MEGRGSFNMLKSMDIWAFEDPIGTPLKYSTGRGTFALQNDLSLAEEEILKEHGDITTLQNNINTGNNFCNEASNYEIGQEQTVLPNELHQPGATNVRNKLHNYSIQSVQYNHKSSGFHPRYNSDNYYDSHNYSYNNFIKEKSKAIIPEYMNVLPDSKFFVIKSYTLEHIERAYKYNIWSSTHIGNKKLSSAFNMAKGKSKIYLFFSVNGSGKFCGIAEMVSNISRDIDTSIWEDNSRYGSAFQIKWICVRDVENRMFRHLVIPDNQFKPVTNSRDTQLIPREVGLSMLNIFQSKNFKLSSFLDPI